MRGAVTHFVATLLLVEADAPQAQVIVADSYNVAAAATGFALNTGVNSGINPPATRLVGVAAAILRYLQTTTKADSAFGISGNKLRVVAAANPGRFTFSTDFTSPFNFASAMRTAAATPASPVVYDLTIHMANNSAGVQRCWFALGAAEGDAFTWDFGIQVHRNASTDNYYMIGKRIDTKASGLGSNLDTFITNTFVGTYSS